MHDPQNESSALLLDLNVTEKLSNYEGEKCFQVSRFSVNKGSVLNIHSLYNMIDIDSYRRNIGLFGQRSQSSKYIQYKLVFDNRRSSYLFLQFILIGSAIIFQGFSKIFSRIFSKIFISIAVTDECGIRIIDSIISSYRKLVGYVSGICFIFLWANHVLTDMTDHNFWGRYENGNGPKRKGIVNMHLNIRSLKNKMHEIKNVVKEFGPHMQGLSECELYKRDIKNDNLLKVPGYDIMFPKSWNENGYARVVVYVKKGFK